ncbi:Histidine-phosphotransfer domain, HPT domain-containing protein [Coniochaeta hoffmannii]|uniref:Histidine-phosphotransfer domain, HPT domain-containing protein n=1 Tax=Coniochaeta hoffmannii TaxID=91930 RepID=A0AA38VTU3_9PEZI|nr:Histidine-phosphotransfer domain, HPT domain-containing protein [Coniochaeta hoffmannii]
MPDSDDRTDEGSVEMPDFGDNVDLATFSQILEMDDDEADRDFSKPLVFNFFEQAEETFGKMDKALANKDLAELSSLGHFLKGSSATLGFLKVKDSCQVIQQYGHKLNLDGSPEPDEQICLSKITEALQAAKDDMAKLETMLKKFFGEGSD